MNLTAIKWIGSTAGLLAAILIAANVAQSGWAFVIFLINSVCWIYAGARMKEPTIILQNVGFGVINVFGVYRWLF